LGSSSKKTAEPEISTLEEDVGDGIILDEEAEPEVSTFQEDGVDGAILDAEESKAPINSSKRSQFSFFAVAATGSMISMWMTL
jgi:hypothetical protein